MKGTGVLNTHLFPMWVGHSDSLNFQCGSCSNSCVRFGNLLKIIYGFDEWHCWLHYFCEWTHTFLSVISVKWLFKKLDMLYKNMARYLGEQSSFDTLTSWLDLLEPCAQYFWFTILVYRCTCMNVQSWVNLFYKYWQKHLYDLYI
jgi:hypothetical protein